MLCYYHYSYPFEKINREARKLKITYLGQAGLLLEKQGLTVMVDPYFSDSVGATNPQKHRRQPVDPRVWDIKPDVMIFTHNHLDHYDPETVQHFITKKHGAHGSVSGFCVVRGPQNRRRQQFRGF